MNKYKKWIKDNKTVLIYFGVLTIFAYGKYKYTKGVYAGAKIATALLGDSQRRFAADTGSDFIRQYSNHIASKGSL